MAWDDRIEYWPRALPSFRLAVGNTALLVIDVQRYCADPEIGLSAVLAQEQPEYAAYTFPRLTNVVLPNIARLLALFRERGWRIVYITIGPECADGMDFRMSRRRADRERQTKTGKPTIFPKGSEGHAVMPEVAPLPGELVLNKVTSCAFTSTGIDRLLRNLGISDLVCTGLATEACVESTARSAADRGYNVVMVDDACQTYEPGAHEWSLRTFARNFGRVADTDAVIRELTAAKS